ncbi:MAG: DUF4194 domain-containing protein [Myxococcaceae bacterium]
MKGVVYQGDDPGLWQSLLTLQPHVRDHVSLLGLELIVDEAEAYAFLRQRPQLQDGAPSPELPRLVPRRQLSHPVSLLLVLLRKKLAEFDATGGDTRLILSLEQITELVRIFLADSANEAKLLDRIAADVGKVVDLGFLRRLKGKEDLFEVRRILKAWVDAQWLDDFDARLRAYKAEGGE